MPLWLHIWTINDFDTITSVGLHHLRMERPPKTKDHVLLGLLQSHRLGRDFEHAVELVQPVQLLSRKTRRVILACASAEGGSPCGGVQKSF